MDESGTFTVVKATFFRKEGTTVRCIETGRLVQTTRLGRMDVKSMSRLMQGFT